MSPTELRPVGIAVVRSTTLTLMGEDIKSSKRKALIPFILSACCRRHTRRKSKRGRLRRLLPNYHFPGRKAVLRYMHKCVSLMRSTLEGYWNLCRDSFSLSENRRLPRRIISSGWLVSCCYSNRILKRTLRQLSRLCLRYSPKRTEGPIRP